MFLPSRILFGPSVLAFCSLIKQHSQASLLFLQVIVPADCFPGSKLQSTFFYVFGAFRFILQASTCEQTSCGHVSLTLSCWPADFGGGEGCAKTNLFPVPVTVTAVTGHSGVFGSVCTNYLPLMFKPDTTAVNPADDDTVSSVSLVLCTVLRFWICSVLFVQCVQRGGGLQV